MCETTHGRPACIRREPREAVDQEVVAGNAARVGDGGGARPGPVEGAAGRREPGVEWFDEMYRGRRIVGSGSLNAARSTTASPSWHVTVDGDPLHLMRRADGSWMTMIDHYQSYPTPLTAARAAVDELGPTTRLGVPGDGFTDDSHGASRSTESQEDRSHGLHT